MMDWQRFLKEESGANLVEYALLLVFIAVAAVTVLQLLSQNIQSTFQTAAEAIGGAS